MAGTKRGMPFERTGPFPIDDKFVLSKAEMLAVDDLKMPEKYFAVNTDDGKFYLYDKSATASAETGKYAVMEGDDGGHVELTQAEYDALTDEQKMDGTVYFITDGVGGDSSVELTQAEYTALSEEEKMNGTTYYITDGGAYVPAVDLIPYVNQAPIVVGKLDLRGDGEFRDIKRVRLWINDLKNASGVITAGWVETGMYVRPIRVYGWFTFHDRESTQAGFKTIIQQLPIPYSGYTPHESSMGGTIGLKFFVDHNNKLRMVVDGRSEFHTDDYACVIIDFMETPIT